MWKTLIRSLASNMMNAFIAAATAEAMAEIDNISRATPNEREAMKAGVNCVVVRLQDKLQGK